MKVFWHYYRIITLYNILFSIPTTLLTGNVYWLPILFCTFGMGAGILAFDYYFKQQYYFYHNMGLTRKKLTFMMLGVNTCIAAPALLLLILFT